MWRYVIPSVLLAGLLVAVGCNRSEQGQVPVAQPPEQKPEEHAHKPGSHNGLIVEIGRDNYHAEAVFEKDGVLRLHTLGKDETRPQEVEVQTLRAFAKPVGGTESMAFTLQAEPQPGDPEGKTTQFVGTLPAELRGSKVEVTVPSITIAGERFRFFIPAGGDGHDKMPPKVASDAERQLYLTPGGMYTEADIEANGRRTASQAFEGMMPSHDARPKPGDKVCPISETKANEKFTWVVGGQTYEFCCPPCVDEFVKLAKEHPEAVKPPSEYVKKK
jgi:hypothetical protein